MSKLMLNILNKFKIVNYYQSYNKQYNEFSKIYNVKYNKTFQLFVFFQWYRSLNSNKSSFDVEMPWITLFSIPFLKKHINKSSIVFEYGSGGSTLFFAKRVKKVISVEHNDEWFEKTKLTIDKTFKNVELNHFPPITSDNQILDYASPDSYISSAELYKGFTFINYASYIDKFPDNHFDIILIDGRARPSCFKHSVSKIKKGGYIIIDNAEREHYLSGVKHLLASFSLVDFPGPIFGLAQFSRTLLLQKN